MEAHVVSFPGSFAEYLKTLPGGVRRKLWNQRSKLIRPEFRAVADPVAVLDRIDAFHVQRWGEAHFTGALRSFHLAFAEKMARSGSLRMSELTTDGHVISMLYNVRIGDTEYNLQAGFDPGRVAGISPGYLHFGYSMEQACAEGVRKYDFLGGEGRHRQYKQDFLTDAQSLVSFHAVRAPHLAWLYRLHDFVSSSRARLRKN